MEPPSDRADGAATERDLERAATATPEIADTALAATATPRDSSSAPGPVDLVAGPLDDRGYEARYDRARELGRGGMGEIHLCKDARVGRSVAMKRMRAGTSASADAVARFVREARVQGQLEHPAIVPVYDLGLAPDGAPYFTMKRLRGLTLETILGGLRGGDPDIASTYSQRKLLTTFSQVCQAIDFAHRHGVLHRDLKPSNIMLGDFGEVYVLDWGLARIAGVADESHQPIDVRSGDDSLDGAHTAAGAVMGTPGYMAPEQLRGEIETLDGRADVYSLGAILF
ncbi:MAG TPA: serine/threonine-protein kinase, partial [Kofleriaceae bacterium]|nr:serine/threonine-protein kinase [Kofleriaceae bacterium]